MGHGIFPNYGPRFIKDICRYLSKKEAKEVFYTSAKERKALERQKKGEDEDVNSRRKKK